MTSQNDESFLQFLHLMVSQLYYHVSNPYHLCRLASARFFLMSSQATLPSPMTILLNFLKAFWIHIPVLYHSRGWFYLFFPKVFLVFVFLPILYQKTDLRIFPLNIIKRKY